MSTAKSSNRNGEGAASAASLSELAAQIRAKIEAAEQGHRTALEQAIEAGSLLAQAKKKVAHGGWIPWLEKEKIPRRTASRYLTLWANGPRVAHLDSVRSAEAEIRKGNPTKSREPKPKPDNAAPANQRLRQRIKQVRSLHSDQRPRWTLEDIAAAEEVLASKRVKSPSGKRLHQIGMKRASARRNGDSGAFWDTSFEISKLISLLESLEIEDVDLDEHNLDVLNDLFDDMLRLQEWADRTAGAIQARVGEQAIHRKIAALRSKTVENGCTEEEASSARKAADTLERRLNALLVA